MNVEIRAIRDDEVAAWVELRNAIDPRMLTMAGWVDQHRRGEATVLAVLAHDGADVVGLGSAEESADRRGSDVGWMSFGVAGHRRGSGVGGALYRELSRHLQTLGKTTCDTYGWSDDEATLAFLRRRGFVKIERFDFVRLDLDTYEPREVEPPPGVAIVPLADRSGYEFGTSRCGG